MTFGSLAKCCWLTLPSTRPGWLYSSLSSVPFQILHFASPQSSLVWLVLPVGSLCQESPCLHSKERDDLLFTGAFTLYTHTYTHTPHISYRWLFYINPNYYGFSASANLLLNSLETGCDGSIFECFPSSSQYYLKYFNFDDVNPYRHIAVRYCRHPGLWGCWCVCVCPAFNPPPLPLSLRYFLDSRCFISFWLH